MRLRNLFRPLYIAGRIQNRLYEKRNPDHPWLAPDAIVWLEKHLRSDMRGFEWGRPQHPVVREAPRLAHQH